ERKEKWEEEEEGEKREVKDEGKKCRGVEGKGGGRKEGREEEEKGGRKRKRVGGMACVGAKALASWVGVSWEEAHERTNSKTNERRLGTTKRKVE
ncbi:hypothetical protein, partial [Staphylococcus aureus]|uniref:hypothetical protein n=1 Tax=Staphylococcus aureus TaxID=1280 RepID=UPI001C9E5EC7